MILSLQITELFTLAPSIKKEKSIRPRASQTIRLYLSCAKTPSELLLQAVETIAFAPLLLFSTSLVVHQAVIKFCEAYRGKPGWSTEYMPIGYELFESKNKTEDFLALGGDEEEE